MHSGAIAIDPYQTMYSVSAPTGLRLLDQSDDVDVELLSQAFTVLKGLHPTHGKLMILISAAGPNLVFGASDLNLEE